MGTNDDNSTKLPDEVLADLMSLISAIDEDAPTPAAPVIPAVKKRTSKPTKAVSKAAAKTPAASKAAPQTRATAKAAPETKATPKATTATAKAAPKTRPTTKAAPETKATPKAPAAQASETTRVLPASAPVPPGPKPTSFAELSQVVDEPARVAAPPVVQLPDVAAADANPLPGVAVDKPVVQPQPLRETPELGELVAAAPAAPPERASRDLLSGVDSSARLAKPRTRVSASWIKYNWPFLLAGFFIAIGAVLIVLVLTSN